MSTPTVANGSSSLSRVLEEHLAVLAEVGQVIQEENSLLKQTGAPPDEAFVRWKSLLLPRLEASLIALRARDGQSELSKPARDMLREAQRRLHKMLLLDRENEALLLRCAICHGGLPAAPVQIGTNQVSSAYGQYA